MFNFFTVNRLLEPDKACYQPDLTNLRSIKGRLFCLFSFFRKLILLPPILLQKAVRFFIKSFALTFSVFGLFISLGISSTARCFFMEKIEDMSKEIAEWFLLPFILLGMFIRSLLGAFIHPGLYLKI